MGRASKEILLMVVTVKLQLHIIADKRKSKVSSNCLRQLRNFGIINRIRNAKFLHPIFLFRFHYTKNFRYAETLDERASQTIKELI